jgi:hypothetical protein
MAMHAMRAGAGMPPRPGARLSATHIPHPMKLQTGGITALDLPESRMGAMAIIVVPSLSAGLPLAPGALPTKAGTPSEAPAITQGITQFGHARLGRETVGNTNARPHDTGRIPDETGMPLQRASIEKIIVVDISVRAGASENATAIQDKATSHAEDPELALLKQRGFSHKKALRLKELYRKEGMPLTDKTVVGDFRDENRIGRMPLLSYDGVPTRRIYEVKYQLGGEVFHGLFKDIMEYADLGLGHGLLNAAIGLTSPFGYKLRNVATYRMSQLFGWNIIPRTEIALSHGRLGIVMERIEGKSLTLDEETLLVTDRPLGQAFKKVRASIENDLELRGQLLAHVGCRAVIFEGDEVAVMHGLPNPDIDFSDPMLFEALEQLQILDDIDGEGDRNHGGMLATFKNGQHSGLMAIDNKSAFGRALTTVDDIVGIRASHAVRFPPAVTQKTFDAVLGLNGRREITGSDIDETLTGVLEPIAIDGVKKRLEEAKAYFRRRAREDEEAGENTFIINPYDLEQRKNIISDSRFTPTNSYLGWALATYGIPRAPMPEVNMT